HLQPDAHSVYDPRDLPVLRRVGRENRGHAQASDLSARRAGAPSMNFSAPFIRRPIATTLLTAAVILPRAAPFGGLPGAPLPQVDFPPISVSAALPGASPEIMASSVATP